jgi:hypothetical protein
MSKQEATAEPNVEDILARLELAKASLVEALEAADPNGFESDHGDGESIKHSVDRTVDELNFYYGRLTARALNLPQPPCLTRSDVGSLREGTMALQVAHRRFTNLLHDVAADDLAKVAADEELGSYTLQQVLEMAVAQYKMRAHQVQRLAGIAPGQPKA